MEFGSPRHETGTLRSPEGDKSSDTSEKKSTKEKDKKLAGSAAVKAEIGGSKQSSEKIDDKAVAERPAETMWQRFAGSGDTDIFGIPKPKQADGPEQKAATGSDSQAEQATDRTNAEVRQATRDFAESRLDDVKQELQSIPASERGSLPAAEAAADAALLRATGEELDLDKDVDPADAIEAAARQVAEDIDRSVAATPERPSDAAQERGAPEETTDSTAGEIAPEAGAEATDAAGATASEHATQPAGEAVIDADDTEDDPAAARTAATAQPTGRTASGPPLPPPPPSGPPPVAGGAFPGGPGGPGGHGNLYPPSPSTAYWNVAPNVPPATPNTPLAANVAPVPAAAVVAPVSSGREQAAAAKGLLAGGIVGYFWGRGRGRKQGAAAANKLNEPVRKALEADKLALQQNLTAKEQQIRQQAHDKFEAAAQATARSKYVEREIQAQQAPRPVVRPEAVAVSGVAGAAAAESVSAAPETATTRQAASSERSPTMHAAEVLAAPLVLAGEMPIRGARVEQAPAAELLVHERHQQERVQAPVIPFNKKAKDFNRQELLATAEKVSVQGTTLKEMVELGRLDEPALRRVTQEFLDGGDVGAAVNREVAAKESFERDPQLRLAPDERDKSPGGTQATKANNQNGKEPGGGGLLAALAGAFGSTSANGKAATKDQAAPAEGRSGQDAPMPDDATLKELRERQMAMVAGGTLLVAVAAVIVALILT